MTLDRVGIGASLRSAVPFLRRLLWLGLPLLAAAAFHAPAHAGAGVIQTVVTALQDNVTYSNATTKPAFNGVIGYTVSVANKGGNTINDIHFTATATVTDAQESAPFVSAEGATCTANGASIDCSLGQLKAGAAYPTFAIFFQSPVKDTVTPTAAGAALQCDTTDCVTLSGTTVYAEGVGGVPNSKPQNSIVPWTSVQVTLGTSNPSLIRSAVPKGGATLFTGTASIPVQTAEPATLFTSLVTIPSGPSFTTAQIQQSPDSANCTFLNNCFRSDITIPGTFSPYLTIVLRVDASNVKAGTKIQTINVTYDDGRLGPDGNPVGPQQVGLCSNPPLVRTDGLPCILSRQVYSKKDPTVELRGDYEWVLINTKNGSYKIF